MIKKNATPKESSTKKSHVNCTSLPAQRLRLLTYLMSRLSIGVTTYEARDDLNIVSPAPRIEELRNQGHKIETIRETLPDHAGRLHPRSARYVLIELAQEGANDE